MQRPLIYVYLLVAALVLVSCTGGDAAPNGQATGEPSATAEPTAVGSADVAAEFAQLLRQRDNEQYRIRYEFTTRAAGQEFAGALTWIRAADGRERFETSSEQAGEAFTLILIRDAAGELLTCFEVGGFASCFEGEDGLAGEIPNPTQVIFDHVLDPAGITDARRTSTREIAEIEATCYEVDAGDGTSEACIGEGGVVLSANWTASNGDGGGFEASEFSTDVSDEDFEPAGPIVG